MNPFERELGILLPKCCSTGDCCKGVSPSTPFYKLLARATQGDEFARNFFSIMVPYKTHAEAEAIVPGVVRHTLEAVKKLDDFPNDADDIVFYHCRYLGEDNRCRIHEDRPQFCRDYPDTPFVVMSPNCAFVPWAKACKKKYFAMRDELEQLSELKSELASLKAQQSSPMAMPVAVFDDALSASDFQQAIADENLSLVLSLTSLYISAPLSSFVLFTPEPSR